MYTVYLKSVSSFPFKFKSHNAKNYILHQRCKSIYQNKLILGKSSPGTMQSETQNTEHNTFWILVILKINTFCIKAENPYKSDNIYKI